MGLDMYLRSKIYIGANFEHNKIKGEVNLTKGETPVKINFNKITYIIEDCGYWRKANHIHRWFVENVQDGEDDCKEYYVTKELLEKLLEDCQNIKSNPTLAVDLLPTQDGFFFGGTDYDEYYWEVIDQTIEIITNVLNDKEEINGKTFLRGEIYYQSSW